MAIDISKLNEADVLAGLYNASKPLGMGFLHFQPEPMTREEAEGFLKEHRYFDYLKGRVMKVDFFDSKRPESERNMPGMLQGERLYDRDNGDGATQRVIDSLVKP